MIHIGGTYNTLEQILPKMRSGDIITHSFTQRPHGILDNNNKIIDISAARERLSTSGAEVLRSLLPGNCGGSWNDMIAHWDEARDPLGDILNSALDNQDISHPVDSI